MKPIRLMRVKGEERWHIRLHGRIIMWTCGIDARADLHALRSAYVAGCADTVRAMVGAKASVLATPAPRSEFVEAFDDWYSPSEQRTPAERGRAFDRLLRVRAALDKKGTP
jgi:hypothetical protein